MTPVFYSFKRSGNNLHTLSELLAYAILHDVDIEVLPGEDISETYSGVQFRFECADEALMFKLKFQV